MATTAKCLYRQARQATHRTQWLQYRQWQQSQRCNGQSTTSIRTFSNTPLRAAEGETNSTPASDSAPYFNNRFFKALDRNDQSLYRGLSPADRKRMETVSQTLQEESSADSRQNRQLHEMIEQYTEELSDQFPDPPAEREPRNDGFFQMGEREDIGPDDEFQEDDITSTAHGELEQHREIREYARLAGWEMPLLANLAVPFEAPTAATPLRFRYTTYMGEQHPAARKVVVEFAPSDLSLTPAQTLKLIKLAGPRYSPVTETVKMSSEAYETQAQNKRYLGDTVQALIAEAKDPNADDFADVPVDFRHVKQKRRLVFPEKWLLTEQRKLELDAKRKTMVEAEAKKAEIGDGLVSGLKAIEEGRKIDVARVEAPIMAAAAAGLPKGKMGKKQMGQKAR